MVYDRSQLPEGAKPVEGDGDGEGDVPDTTTNAVAVVEEETEVDSGDGGELQLIDETHSGKTIDLRGLINPSGEGALSLNGESLSQPPEPSFTPNADEATP